MTTRSDVTDAVSGWRIISGLDAEENVAVEEAPVLQGVSSTLVREALAGGRVEEAARMLGRPYTVAGAVVHGRHLGRELGFPTANVDHDIRMVLPASGVYAAEVAMPDGTLRIAVVNVGTRPTVSNGNDISLEAHIPDFRGDLYGRMFPCGLSAGSVTSANSALQTN